MRRPVLNPTVVRVGVVLAALLVISGTSYAAVQVTGKDIKNNSVTGKDIKDGSLRSGDFKPGELPSGAPGPTGPSGPTGPPGAAGPGAQRIDVSVANGSFDQLAVGPWTLRVDCTGDAAHRLMLLGVVAGGGAIQFSAIKSISDNPASTIPVTAGAAIPAAGFFGIGVNQPNPGNTSGFFYRANGSFVLQDDTAVTTVVFDMFLENRGNQGTCELRGTATPSS